MFINIIKILFLVSLVISCSGGGGGSEKSISTSGDSVIKSNFIAKKEIPKGEFLKVLSSLEGMRGSFFATTDLSFKEELKTCAGSSSLLVKFNDSSKTFSVERTVVKNSGSCNKNSPNLKFQTKNDLRLDRFFNFLRSDDIEVREGTYENKPGYLISVKGNKFTVDYVLGVKDKLFDYLVTETNYNQTDGYFKILTKVSPVKTFQFDENLVEDTPETGDIIELSELGVISLIN